jgi:hypothetical protein
MREAGRIARRLSVAALAAMAVTAAAHAAPAAAEPNFGAANLGEMQITEGGTLDYAVSLPSCPPGYECTLTMYASSAHATKDVDFRLTRGPDPSRAWKAQDGPIVGISTIQSIDDAIYEGDEPFFMTARIDYYPGGCPNGRPGSSASCLPESSWRWSGPVFINDNDSRFAKRYVKGGVQFKRLRGHGTKRLGKARTRTISETFDIPFDHTVATGTSGQAEAARPVTETAAQAQPQQQPERTIPAPVQPAERTAPEQQPYPFTDSATQTPPSSEGTVDYGGCACPSGGPGDPR